MEMLEFTNNNIHEMNKLLRQYSDILVSVNVLRTTIDTQGRLHYSGYILLNLVEY